MLQLHLARRSQVQWNERARPDVRTTNRIDVIIGWKPLVRAQGLVPKQLPPAGEKNPAMTRFGAVSDQDRAGITLHCRKRLWPSPIEGGGTHALLHLYSAP